MGRRQSLDLFTALFFLFIVGLVVYPFILLYEKLGGIGFLFIVALCFACGLFWKKKRKQRDNQEFQALVLETIYRRMHPDEAKSINLALMRKDFRKAELIRFLQIIRDSIEISLTSKKRDVAESRMQTIIDHHGQIQSYRAIVNPEIWQTVEAVIDDAVERFHTLLYSNIAKGYIEKAGALKTEKGRQKYWLLAKDIINEGLIHPKSNKDELEKLSSFVSEKLHGEAR